MPPPDARPAPGSPADWLRHARSDLAFATPVVQPGMLLETMCYPPQQAAEKAIEAVLVAEGRRPPRTHDLNVLTAALSQPAGLPPAVEQAGAVLDRHAVHARYPDDLGEVDEREWRVAVDAARRIVG